MREEDALKAITLNPAKQLGLDGRIGTIEVGKDADLAIFNGHPLNGFARCEMTLVEGEVYFQRSDKLTAFAPAVAGPTKPGGTSHAAQSQAGGRRPFAERDAAQPGRARGRRRTFAIRRARSTRSAAS